MKERIKIHFKEMFFFKSKIGFNKNSYYYGHKVPVGDENKTVT